MVLMLIESGNFQADSVQAIHSTLARATRETDVKGWYREGTVFGVIFTEISLAETSIVDILSRKVREALVAAVGVEQFSALEVSFHLFPDDLPGQDKHRRTLDWDAFSIIYPDLAREMETKRVALFLKRCLDISGSLAALVFLAPVIALIAAAVKMTSPGPVLFKQKRLGQYGQEFTFLKFRSMFAKSDHAIHEAYIKSFISDRADSNENAKAGVKDTKVFKLQGDPRVTRVGRFLRRTSLDEIPQFFSVLTGHMSLVGPRPPLQYEFAAYEVWHRRRLLAVKPGITGFWQVEGRSRVKFDEMVRMDLEYARTWSLWHDIRILLRTPGAVLGGNGAY